MTDRSACGANARGFLPLVFALVFWTGCAQQDSAPMAQQTPASQLPSLANSIALQVPPASSTMPMTPLKNDAVCLASATDRQSSRRNYQAESKADETVTPSDDVKENSPAAATADTPSKSFKSVDPPPQKFELVPEPAATKSVSNATNCAAEPIVADHPAEPAPPAQSPEPQLADLSTAPGMLPWGPSKPSPEMAAICRRAEETARNGFNLAERGALYSARSQFIDTLQILTEALDAQHNTTAHTRALNAGLRALQEVNDFVPRSGELATDLNFRLLVDSHHTPVLKDGPLDHITPLQAQRMYLSYAQEQLAAAGEDQPVASLALHGLGKICTVPPEMHGPPEQIAEAKAVVYHQAALMIEPKNFMAANELGVLLAHFGNLPEARSALEHAVAMSGGPTEWQNLAAVCQRLGQTAKAADARQQATIAAARLQNAGYSTAGMKYPIQWLDPDSFATTNSMVADAAPVTHSVMASSSTTSSTAANSTSDAATPAIAAKPQPKSGFWSWLK